ncbi:MAG: hypothetical protein Q7R79_05145, partial [bacterium]|nr:hypothetical protein [bacterium]
MKKTLIGIVFCFTSFFWALEVSALSFDPNHIISDLDFFSENEMDTHSIQQFLERKESTLASYTDTDIDGVRKSAAAIIARAAKTHGINPKVLLVLLQ